MPGKRKRTAESVGKSYKADKSLKKPRMSKALTMCELKKAVLANKPQKVDQILSQGQLRIKCLCFKIPLCNCFKDDQPAVKGRCTKCGTTEMCSQCSSCSNDPELPSLLFLAAEKGHTQVVKVLVKHGFNIRSMNSDFESPIFSAVRGGHLDTVKWFAEHGAELEEPNAGYLTIIWYAVQESTVPILQYLLQRGCSIDHFSKYEDTTAMFRACEQYPYNDENLRETRDFVRIRNTAVLAIQHSQNLQVLEETSLLHQMIDCRKLKLAAVLVIEGADVNFKGEMDEIPFWMEFEEDFNEENCLEGMEYSPFFTVLASHQIVSMKHWKSLMHMMYAAGASLDERYRTFVDQSVDEQVVILLEDVTSAIPDIIKAEKEVKSLKWQCRLAVREKLGERMTLQVRPMKIPKSLKDYLLLKEYVWWQWNDSFMFQY